MVKVVQLGIPNSYSKFIANTGLNMPHTYNEWKAQVIVMHEEQQKKWVFDQTTSAPRDSCPSQKGHGNTTTSQPKTGGVTSSSLGKPTSSTPSQDAGSGRWVTHGGPGLPMDIGKLCAEGRCFRCHKKGHLAFNVSSTTSKPVLESQNQYTVLSINDNDNDLDLCPWDDGHDAGDTAATTGRPSRQESGGGDPAMQGTSQALKSKQSSPPSLGPVR
ncbi:hypothetical protein ARMSODRAFT_979997 [Armillaria solidipes]|uniref:CCHC-type domain-containing protein n=1 Tax=Armillaria solidipes TaxID=1076256 RepID=A0A2H3B376_9AGAR|nr:hypothetical protein ARMSODRAFT_979997 [Armillaria solidipes]